jgi:hypothetical protein
MPNWCWNTVTIEGDVGTLTNMDFIMKSEGYEHAGDSHDMGQPMRLVPMPEILQGTRSPAPNGEFDPEGKIMEWVNDPENDYWTPEKYAEDKAEHYALIDRAKRAEAETGHSDWYSWAHHNWGTKWSVDVTGYDYNPEQGVIYISGNTAWAPPITLWEKVSQKFGVTISGHYVEEGMDFIGAFVVRNGRVFDSCGSFSDHLPEGFDWDNDDAYEIHDEVRDRLIDHHEIVVASEAGLVGA